MLNSPNHAFYIDPVYGLILLIYLLLWYFQLRVNTRQRRELVKSELKISSLVYALQALGIKVEEDRTSFSGLKYTFTKAAKRYAGKHYFGSQWNLDRQLEQEANEDKATLATAKEPEGYGDEVKDHGATVMGLQEAIERLDRQAKSILPTMTGMHDLAVGNEPNEPPSNPT